MSALEPLAAFGLACSVFQTISFTREVYQACNKIFHGEKPDHNLSNNVDQLFKFFDSISTATNSAPKPLTENDRTILDIATECKTTAVEMKAQADTLSGGQGSGWRSLKLALKYRLKLKSRIAGLEKRLNNQQSLLESRLLGNICNKVDAANICQASYFAKLDSHLRQFITAIATEQNRLAVQIAQESTSIKEHITGETTSLRKAIFDEAKHEKLLRSLKYGSMNERRNHITDPAADTFDWIFHPSVEKRPGLDDSESTSDEEHGLDEDYREFWSLDECVSARQSASSQFLEWLQSADKSLFWISGKPGSGKSTLMKFLAAHPATLDHLQTSGGSFLILSHFIWSAGQPMERQIKGVLCSLLHQLLESVKDIAGVVLEQHSQTASKDSVHDWSEGELRTVLKFAIQNADGNGICIFVDGIDEIDPEHSDGIGQKSLLEVLQDISALSPVKLCVASRPEPILKTKLSRGPTFKIHEVTHWDIWKFASSIFRQRFAQFSHVDYRQFLCQVYRMAEGVFLWVALALRSLEMGLEKGDDIEKLQTRLSKLPKGLNELYGAMWSRQGEEEAIYQEDAATYFNYMLIHQDILDPHKNPYFLTGILPLKLTDLFLSQDTALMKRLPSQNMESPPLTDKMISELELFACRLEVCCAGMVEVTRTYPSPLSYTVSFIHRSAKEFFEDQNGGRTLLQHDPANKGQRAIELAKAILTTDLLSTALGILPARQICLSPDLFLAIFMGLLHSYSRLQPSSSYVSEIADFVEHLVNSRPSTCLYIWPMLPWVDFLGLVASAGLFEVLQERLEAADGIGAVSSDYNAYLLTAALTGLESYDLGERLGYNPRRKLETINLLAKREINPDFRSYDFYYPQMLDKILGEPLYITPVEAAVRRLLTSFDITCARRTMALVINRLLDFGADLTKLTIFTLWDCNVIYYNEYHSSLMGLRFFPTFGGFRNLGAAEATYNVESTLAVLLDMAAAVFSQHWMMDDDSTQLKLAKRITGCRASRTITRIFKGTRTYSGCSTERAGLVFSRQALLMRGTSVKCLDTINDSLVLRIPGFDRLREELGTLDPDDKDMPLPLLVDQIFGWAWDDERARRPWRYRDVPEPVWDVSAHLKLLREYRERQNLWYMRQ